MVARAKLVINGALGNPAVERWSTGIHITAGGTDLPNTPAALQTWASTCASALALLTNAQNPRSMLSSSGSITDVACYYYAGPGPATLSATAPVGAGIAGSGTPTMPPQCSQVITLRTALAGRRNRGRIYWPRLVGTMTAGLKITQSQSLADDFAALLRAFENDGSTTGAYQIAVYSAAGETLTPVSSISVGDVVDTQRRRRDALQEIRLSANL